MEFNGKVLKVRSDGTVEWSPTSNDVSGSMSVSGSILPTIDNFHDLGSDTQKMDLLTYILVIFNYPTKVQKEMR